MLFFDSTQGILSFLMAFGITVLLAIILRPIALKLNLVDIPGGRKTHRGHIPLIGGIAMFLGFCFAILTLPVSLVMVRSLLQSSLLLVIAGVLDDFHELNHRTKLLAQLFAALIMAVWGGNQLHSLGNLFFLGELHFSGLYAILLTVFATVGLINAVNMLDGLDGLAGSVVLVQFIFFIAIALYNHLALDQHVLAILIGALLGFLCFNLPIRKNQKYRIFMGDAGSLFLGLMLSWFSIHLTQQPYHCVSPITMLWICALPLFDSLAAIGRRLYKGHSPFVADRQHWHYVLKQAGFNAPQIVCLSAGVSLFLGLFGLFLYWLGCPEGISFILFVITSIGFLKFMHYANSTGFSTQVKV